MQIRIEITGDVCSGKTMIVERLIEILKEFGTFDIAPYNISDESIVHPRIIHECENPFTVVQVLDVDGGVSKDALHTLRKATDNLIIVRS